MVPISRISSAFRPGNLSLANANPASEQKNRIEKVTMVDTTKLFHSDGRKNAFSCANTSLKLSIRCVPGVMLGGSLASSSSVLDPTMNIQYSGNADSSRVM